MKLSVIKSIAKRGEVFNQSDFWVFRVAKEVFALRRLSNGFEICNKITKNIKA